MLSSGLVSECIFFFECKLQPEPEPGAALAGLGSELGLEIYQAQALKKKPGQSHSFQAKPGCHITSWAGLLGPCLSHNTSLEPKKSEKMRQKTHKHYQT